MDTPKGWSRVLKRRRRRKLPIELAVVEQMRPRWESLLDVQLLEGIAVFSRREGAGDPPMDSVQLHVGSDGFGHVSLTTHRGAMSLRFWRSNVDELPAELDAALTVLAGGPLVPGDYGYFRHDALVLRGRTCSACGSPGGTLVLYRHRPSDRLFVKCDELDEAWWDLDALDGPPQLDPLRDMSAWDINDWDLADEFDLQSSGWNASLFEWEEMWWTA